MSDLKLVSPNQSTAFEQRLLDAVAHEAPSAEQRARVRLALGLPAIVPAAVPVASVGRRALVLKTAGGLIVVSVAVIALLSAIDRNSTFSKPPATPLVAPQAATATPIEAPATAAPASASLAPESGAPAIGNTRDVVTPNKPARKPAALDNGANLSEQLRLIDAARSAVAAGNAAVASAALNSYRTRFPRGPFGQEAAVLQIETLDLQGNHSQAAAQARSFLARHPNSPHVSIVQRIAGR
jgi:TolA-binding protein